MNTEASQHSVYEDDPVLVEGPARRGEHHLKEIRSLTQTQFVSVDVFGMNICHPCIFNTVWQGASVSVGLEVECVPEKNGT